MNFEVDFLIIGSGIAGLSLAIKLADTGRVTIITKKECTNTATSLAQGGIACVVSDEDSFERHIKDTLSAGDGLCHEDIVEMVIKEAPQRIKELQDWGVSFALNIKEDGGLDLGKEGGHSKRRIVHVGDYTGRAIQDTLLERVKSHPNITVLPYHVAIDLITEGKIKSDPFPSTLPPPFGKERCLGAYVLDAGKGEIHAFLAPVTILATGGAGKVYLYTSNPDVAAGDGIAMAYRAGARIANMEFVQFHPTCLYHPQAKNFLISEAMRGEGARLLNYKGEAFMERYCPERKELSNRDEVARAIDLELKTSGKDCVYLDISHRPKDFIKDRFPYIYETCLKFGYDITREPVPVVPAAHYMSGGVVVDRFAQTDINGLFAIGETACTGLHGANRLASNSLLECLVMAHQASVKIKKDFEDLKTVFIPTVPSWDVKGAVDMDESVLITHNWDAIRRLMWNYVGIVRSDKRLGLASLSIRPIIEEIRRHYWDYKLTSDFVELRNLAQVAELIIISANRRKESRGGHYNMDHPWKDDWSWRRDTIIVRGEI